MTPRVFATALAYAALFGWLSTATAQDRPVVELTPKHSAMLDEATTLNREGSNREALKIYDTLLRELDMDLLHLNRGRILMRLGECEAAQEAFTRVPDAPRVPDIPQEQLRERLNVYIGELHSSCDGHLIVTCSQPGMTVRIPGSMDKARSCEQLQVSLQPGQWRVVGELHEQLVEQTVTVIGTETTQVALALERDQFVAAGRVMLSQERYDEALKLFEEAQRQREGQEAQFYKAEALLALNRCDELPRALERIDQLPPGRWSPLELKQHMDVLRSSSAQACDPVEPTEPPASNPMGTIGLIGVGLGAATLATALVIDVAVITPDIEDFERARDAGAGPEELSEQKSSIERLQRNNKVLLATGGAFALAGGGLLLADWLWLGGDEEGAQQLSVQWLEGGAAVTWGVAWP